MNLNKNKRKKFTYDGKKIIKVGAKELYPFVYKRIWDLTEYDKELLISYGLKKAKYIRSGQFNETNGNPVLKVSGNIDLTEEVPVPDIEPDIQYPFLQKQLAEKLNITTTCLYALIWKYDMKKQKKYHMEISTTSTGKNKSHKFSDIALQFLAEEINKHKDDSNWLESIRKEHQAFKNEHNSIKK